MMKVAQRDALARQNARSVRVCLDFSLVTLLYQDKRKWIVN